MVRRLVLRWRPEYRRVAGSSLQSAGRSVTAPREKALKTGVLTHPVGECRHLSIMGPPGLEPGT